jgi:hypothetical protein
MHRRSSARERSVEEPRPLAEEPREQPGREHEESAQSHLDPAIQAAIQADPERYLEDARKALPRKRRQSDRSHLEQEALKHIIHADPERHLFKAKGKLKALEESTPSRDPATSELRVKERLQTGSLSLGRVKPQGTPKLSSEQTTSDATILQPKSPARIESLKKDGAMAQRDFDRSCEEDERKIDVKAQELDHLIESLSSGLEGAISRDASKRNLEIQERFNNICSAAYENIDALAEIKTRHIKVDISREEKQRITREYNSEVLKILESTINVLSTFNKKDK